MQNHELAGLAAKIKQSTPHVESFSIASIYRALKEHENIDISLAEFKDFIYHLTGWDISFQVISRQLEINEITI